MTTSIHGSTTGPLDPTLSGFLLDDVEGATPLGKAPEPTKTGKSTDLQAKLAKLEELTKAGKLDPKKMEELTELAKKGKIDTKRLDELIQLLLGLGDDPERIRDALAAIGVGAPRQAPPVPNPRAAPPPQGTIKAGSLPAARQMSPQSTPAARPAWGGGAPIAGADAMRASNIARASPGSTIDPSSGVLGTGPLNQVQHNSMACGQASAAMFVSKVTGRVMTSSEFAGKHGFGLRGGMAAETGKTIGDTNVGPGSKDLLVKAANGDGGVLGLSSPYGSKIGHIYYLKGYDPATDKFTLANPADGKNVKVSFEDILRDPGHRDGKFFHFNTADAR
jgi:hypothetical protein